MKRFALTAKIAILISIVGYLVLFWTDLLESSADVGLLDKFFLTTPVLLAIRISIIFVAFGIVLLVCTTLWKGAGIAKIGSTGIEFNRFDVVSSKNEEELESSRAKIRGLKVKISTLEKEKRELEDLVNNLVLLQKEIKNE